MKEARLTDVRTSINRRQNTVAQYIATRPLLDLCEGGMQREGERVTMRWWYQTGIDWERQKRGKRRRNRSLNRGQTWRGGRRRTHKAGQAAQVGRNGAGRVQANGKYGKLDNIIHSTESSDWVAAVLGLKKKSINEHAIWSR